MKRFSKVCLSIALVLGILGVVGCTAGIALGAGKNIVLDEVRTEKTLNQVGKILDAAERLGDRMNETDWEEVAKDVGMQEVEYDEFTDAETTEYTFSPEEVKEIQVQTVGDIQIKKSEDTQIKVIVKTRNCKIDVKAEQEKLSVSKEKTDWTKGMNISSIVRIQVPQSISWKNINFETSAGDIDIAEALQAQEIQMKSSAGDIQCEKNLQAEQTIQVTASAGDVDLCDLSASETTIKVMAGDLDVTGKVQGNLNLENMAGDIDIEGSVQGNLQAKASAGNVDLELNGRLEDYNYDVKATCGDVTVNEQSYEKTVGGAYQQEFGAKNKISVKATAGDVDITVE